MSIRLMSEVWLTKLPTTEKMVLLVIADHANDEGTASYPSQETIARKVSIGIRQVRRHVNELVTKGYIRVQKGAGGSERCRDDRRPNLYTINLNRLRADARDRADADDLNGRTPKTVTGGRGRPLNLPIEPSIEQFVKVNTAFDLFWKVYPLKVGKAAAKKAWDKAVAEAGDQDWIINGASRYAQDPNRHPSYTAYPATWLNAGRWADEPLPPREISAEEKKAQEVESARLKFERDRKANEAWFAEQEAQRAKSVPMPESIKDLLRKRVGK